MEDIGKVQWVDFIFEIARGMIKFVRRKPKVLNIYQAYNKLELLQPSSTSFAYMFIVAERLLQVCRELVRTAYSNEWLQWDERHP